MIAPDSSPANQAVNSMGWFLVRSKPRHELTALTNLVRQGYEVYLPVFMAEKIVRRKAALVREPMFARYLFVRLDITGQRRSWSSIRSTIGVSELVRFGNTPARVDDALIAILREREVRQRENPHTLFSAGESVLITSGPFVGLEAIYQMSDAEGRAMVLLNLLEKPVAVKINFEILRKKES